MESSLIYNAGKMLGMAREMLTAARKNADIDEIKTALNRSYYAVFYAMCAANALDGFSSSKHSGVISHFTVRFLKTEELPPELSDIIKESLMYREKADYNPDFTADGERAAICLNNASYFLETVEKYIADIENAGQ